MDIQNIRAKGGAVKEALSHKIQYLTEFLGGEYDTEGDYQAWEYRKDSPLRDKMVEVYRDLYGKELKVVAIHAGLECGLFYERMEGRFFYPQIIYVEKEKVEQKNSCGGKIFPVQLF